MQFQIGEYVTRKSYQHDVLFQIVDLKQGNATLQGIQLRLIADAPVEDLEKVEERTLEKKRQDDRERIEHSFQLFREEYQVMKQKQNRELRDDVAYFQLPIRVLHIDGDEMYLKKCLQVYKRLGLQAEGVHIEESQMPYEIAEHIKRIRPNCLVVTGHDAFKLKKGEPSQGYYRNSHYFAETIRRARDLVPDLDDLVIFAGACQSYFELLIQAGANFASVPERVNIHALDPVYIMAKVAYTSCFEKVCIYEMIRGTLTGLKGIGGLETKGLQRIGLPYRTKDSVRKVNMNDK